MWSISISHPVSPIWYVCMCHLYRIFQNQIVVIKHSPNIHPCMLSSYSLHFFNFSSFNGLIVYSRFMLCRTLGHKIWLFDQQGCYQMVIIDLYEEKIIDNFMLKFFEYPTSCHLKPNYLLNQNSMCTYIF